MDNFDTERKARQLVALLDLMSCAAEPMRDACGPDGIEALLCVADDLAVEVLDSLTSGNFLCHADEDCLKEKEPHDEESHERGN